MVAQIFLILKFINFKLQWFEPCFWGNPIIHMINSELIVDQKRAHKKQMLIEKSIKSKGSISPFNLPHRTEIHYVIFCQYLELRRSFLYVKISRYYTPNQLVGIRFLNFLPLFYALLQYLLKSFFSGNTSNVIKMQIDDKYTRNKFRIDRYNLRSNQYRSKISRKLCIVANNSFLSALRNPVIIILNKNKFVIIYKYTTLLIFMKISCLPKINIILQIILEIFSLRVCCLLNSYNIILFLVDKFTHSISSIIPMVLSYILWSQKADIKATDCCQWKVLLLNFFWYIYCSIRLPILPCYLIWIN